MKITESAFRILREMQNHPQGIKYKEIMAVAGIPRGTVYFKIQELIEAKLVHKIDHGVYAIADGVDLAAIEIGERATERAPKVRSQSRNVVQKFDDAFSDLMDAFTELRELVLSPDQIEDYRRLKDQEEQIIAAMQPLKRK